MCRLFGLIANKPVGIKFSMLEAPRSFISQSLENPDGWGIGYYLDSKAEVEKKGEIAWHSDSFRNLSYGLRSRIFIAHVRYASSGSEYSDENAHPFVFENWIFAHNGTIFGYRRLIEKLRPPYSNNFTSEPIDSEVYFRYLLQCIDEENDVIEGIRKCTNEIIDNSSGANFVMSDGKRLYAYKSDRDLYFVDRTFKGPFIALSSETRMLLESKELLGEKAILVATERLTGYDEDWKPLEEHSLLICNPDLTYKLIEM